jgi:aryl-alcohol dehydrogenase-like predicted oxidoreductase
MIRKVKLGRTGESISEIGLGTMYFGSKVNEHDSFMMLDRYSQVEGSFLDSANKYASWVPGFKGGESEQVIGKWLSQRGNRQNMFISSKVGFQYGEIPRSLKKEIIISECEKSLKRFGVDCIDLYFAHVYYSKTSNDEIMEAFCKLIETGKIRFAGASNYYAWQLAEANLAANRQGWEGFCCIQQRHTYLEPTLWADFDTQLLLTREIQEFCKKKTISLMAYSPLLGGAYVRNDRIIPVQYQSAINDFKMAGLKEIAAELQVSANAVVLAWMMQSSPSVIPMVSGSTVAQLNENLSVLSFTLSKNQMERLNQDIVHPNKYS